MVNKNKMVKKNVKKIDDIYESDESEIISDNENENDSDVEDEKNDDKIDDIIESDSDEFASEMLSDSDNEDNISKKNTKNKIKKMKQKSYDSDTDSDNLSEIGSNDDDCVYEYEEDIDEKNDKDKLSLIVPKEERITRPILTKYEMIRILATRTAQLIKGAPMTVNIHSSLLEEYMEKPILIAKLELKNKVMPYKVRRPLPNGKYEEWACSELEIPIVDFPL